MGHDGDDSRAGGLDGAEPVADSVDHERLAKALDRHPVRLAVLFGSRVTDAHHADSDADVAVEFERGAEPEDALLPLLADLTSATGGTDVDVAVLSDLEPRIGVSVCRDGVLLVGDPERFERHCKQFREALQEADRRSARDRFREIVETAKRAVGQDA